MEMDTGHRDRRINDDDGLSLLQGFVDRLIDCERTGTDDYNRVRSTLVTSRATGMIR